MTILARFQNRHVKILDVFTTGDGRKLAIVQALEGQPFTSWTHGGWAASDTTTIRADFLQDVAAESRPAGNLLTLALANAKSQWYAGESVWLWRKVDDLVIDGSVNGVAAVVRVGSLVLRRVQTGYVMNYVLSFIVGVVAILGYLAFWR